MIFKTKQVKMNELTNWHNKFVLFAQVDNKIVFMQTIERRAVFVEAFNKVHRVFEYRMPNVNLKPVYMNCAAKTKKSEIAKTKTSKKSTSSTNKRAQVEAIVKSMPNSSRADILDRIMKETNMTKQGASTYYYNAKKALTS